MLCRSALLLPIPSSAMAQCVDRFDPENLRETLTEIHSFWKNTGSFDVWILKSHGSVMEIYISSAAKQGHPRPVALFANQAAEPKKKRS